MEPWKPSGCGEGTLVEPWKPTHLHVVNLL